MIQLSSEHHHRQLQRANRGVCALGLAAGLAVRGTEVDLPPPFDSLSYSNPAELLLVAAVGPLEATIRSTDAAMRLARCEGLIVQASSTDSRRLTLDLTAGLWLSKCNQWHLDLRAWVAPDHRVWLVPARLDLGARPSFQLRPQRLRPESAPWTDAGEREAGLALADMLFAEER